MGGTGHHQLTQLFYCTRTSCLGHQPVGAVPVSELRPEVVQYAHRFNDVPQTLSCTYQDEALGRYSR